MRKEWEVALPERPPLSSHPPCSNHYALSNVHIFGISTVSITCMTPFEAWISVFVTRASSTVTPGIVLTLTDPASSVFTVQKINGTAVLGGEAFRDLNLRQRFPAEFYAESFEGLSTFVKELAKT